MEFPTSSKSSLNESLDSFEIVNLNAPACEELFSLIDEKKFDCKTKESKKSLSENQVFISFVLNSIQKLDPLSKKLSKNLLKSFIFDFLHGSYTLKDIPKLLSTHQLKHIVSLSKMPESMQEELNNTIAYYLEQYPDSYPYNKLIGFIRSKHLKIHSYLPVERLRDYISLSFLVYNSQENISFSSYELMKRVESTKTESEVSNEISSYLDKKLNSVSSENEKLIILSEFYSDFSAAVCPRKGLKKRIKVIEKNINGFLVNLLCGRSHGDLELLKKETDLKNRILIEMLKILEFYSEKSKKFENYSEKIFSFDERQISDKQAEVRNSIFGYFETDRIELRSYSQMMGAKKEREKIIEKAKVKIQELFHLLALHNMKISKTKKIFKRPNGIKELINSDYLKKEEELYRKGREISMRLKMVEFQNRKVLEQRILIENEIEKKTGVGLLKSFLACFAMFLIGIVFCGACEYLKILD